MAEGPLDLTLELAPRARFDVVELRSRLPIEYRDALAPYPYCLYWSAHTTAGFLDRSLIARLGPARVPTYVDALRHIFPEGAGYAHDRLERRLDLDAAQRAVEPRNADSHLVFIAGGLRPCVTHPNRAGETVCFVDLDGVKEGRPRRRLTAPRVGAGRAARAASHALPRAAGLSLVAERCCLRVGAGGGCGGARRPPTRGLSPAGAARCPGWPRRGKRSAEE